MAPDLARMIEAMTCRTCLGNGSLADRDTYKEIGGTLKIVDVCKPCTACDGTGIRRPANG